MAFTHTVDAPDTKMLSIGIYALTANTNKEIAIPKGAIGFHFYPLTVTALTYFKKNGAMAVPTATASEGGFLATGTDSARDLYEHPCAVTTDTLNLINTTSGNVVVEFYGW
jgi:hypothetical protein